MCLLLSRFQIVNCCNSNFKWVEENEEMTVHYKPLSLSTKGTVKMLYVMLTFGKTQKYYFLNRMKYNEGSFVKSSGKIS